MAAMVTIAPYGSWVSPLSATDIAGEQHPVSGALFVGDALWWAELRSAEGGRYAVCRRDETGLPVDVLPAPWNARSRVHEYGGGAWTATQDGRLVFVEFTDQRLYRLDPGSAEPVPLTPASTPSGSARYAEVSVRPAAGEVWCVRERHEGGGVIRDIAAVPLDGSAVNDASQIRSVVGGSHFLAYPRLSPSGRQLAWIAWEHPQLPWDGTELRVADIGPDGTCGPWRTLLGSPTESVLQPEWVDESTLYAVSDRTGWWNLYRVGLDGAATPLAQVEADFAGPLWGLGTRWYAPLPDGRLLTVRTLGIDRLAVLDPTNGSLTDLDAGGLTDLRIASVRGTTVAVLSGSAQQAHGLRLLDFGAGTVSLVRSSLDGLPDADYLPQARAMTFAGPGGREVHSFVYAPRSPDYLAPDGELPPYVALVHGGPTAHVSGRLSLAIAYFTSRGIGVVDVNYGGSSGYGREYRERLRGQWGVVDVEDVVAVVLGLADAGLADRARLAIEGGSAGGWTVLAALTRTDVFACGGSYYGVADLTTFAEDTHDFESRYLDGLIGPLPQARALYDERAPINHVDGLSCPVLLLQGLDDPIVPPSQSERFRDAMIAKGIPHAYLPYAGESHGFRRASTLVHSREAELSFYGQIMGFDPPGVPRLPLWRP
jgi:dipeptidyl aminopeptidase/acylaminoacyl peptidase